jgi:hypothetical protein
MPEVFAQVAQQVPVVGQWAAQSGGLGFDFSAIFSGIGSAITSALPTIANVAGTLAVSNANKQLISAQAKLAASQAAPIQTGYYVNPQTGAVMSQPVAVQAVQQVPVQYVQPSQQPAYTVNAAGQIVASATQGAVAPVGWFDGQTGGIPNKVLALGGGAALLGLFALSMRRG